MGCRALADSQPGLAAGKTRRARGSFRGPILIGGGCHNLVSLSPLFLSPFFFTALGLGLQTWGVDDGSLWAAEAKKEARGGQEGDGGDGKEQPGKGWHPHRSPVFFLFCSFALEGGGLVELSLKAGPDH